MLGRVSQVDSSRHDIHEVQLLQLLEVLGPVGHRLESWQGFHSSRPPSCIEVKRTQSTDSTPGLGMASMSDIAKRRLTFPPSSQDQ